MGLRWESSMQRTSALLTRCSHQLHSPLLLPAQAQGGGKVLPQGHSSPGPGCKAQHEACGGVVLSFCHAWTSDIWAPSISETARRGKVSG